MFTTLTPRLNLLALALLIAGAATGAAATETAVKPQVSIAGTAAPHDIGCIVKCVDPTVTCEESKKVLEILQKLITAYAGGDLKTYEKYLDEHCSMFDEADKKMIMGKEAILARLKNEFAEHAPGGPKPLVSLTIDQPYLKVIGEDRCVVTFVATKEIGGQQPVKERANITDVFVKRNGEWKKTHWRGGWEVVAEK